MTQFFESFKSVLGNLFKMQMEEPPDIFLYIISQILRFGLLALCVVSLLLFIKLVTILVDFKHLSKNAKALIYTCITLAICTAVSIGAFLPTARLEDGQISSVAFQNVLYTEDALFTQTDETTQADSEGEGENTGGEDAQETTAETRLVVESHTELAPQYVQSVTQLIVDTQCTRTLMREVPKTDGQNLLVRLEDGTQWHVRLVSNEGYIFISDEADFIYKINDYAEFHAELADILQSDA